MCFSKGVVAVGFVLESPSEVLTAIVELRDWLATVHQWLSTQIPSQAIGEGSSAISLMLEDLNVRKKQTILYERL